MQIWELIIISFNVSIHFIVTVNICIHDVKNFYFFSSLILCIQVVIIVFYFSTNPSVSVVVRLFLWHKLWSFYILRM